MNVTTDDPKSTHGGYFKTIEMDEDVRQYLINCEECKAIKSTNEIQTASIGRMVKPSQPWETIFIDFI